jgi:hypothetical protein
MSGQSYWTSNRTAKVGRLIKSLYDVVRELEKEFVDEKRKFTLDTVISLVALARLSPLIRLV